MTNSVSQGYQYRMQYTGRCPPTHDHHRPPSAPPLRQHYSADSHGRGRCLSRYALTLRSFPPIATVGWNATTSRPRESVTYHYSSQTSSDSSWMSCSTKLLRELSKKMTGGLRRTMETCSSGVSDFCHRFTFGRSIQACSSKALAHRLVV